MLNRDTWSNAALKQFVVENFVFCQPSLASEAGQWYTRFYPVGIYPHVAVLDPITRARLGEVTFEGPLEPALLLQRLSAFVRDTPRPEADVPVVVEPAVAPDAAPVSKRRKWELTEDEQLARAIAESMSADADVEIEEGALV